MSAVFDRPGAGSGPNAGRHTSLAGAVAWAALVLAGCSTPVRDRVVLLPQADGRPSAVVVSPRDAGAAAASGTAVRLDKPYASAELQGSRLQPVQSDADTTRQRYGALIDALPMRPQRFTVRFETNSNTLTADTAPVLDRVIAAMRQVPAAELVVTGHTDRVGTLDANDRLSLARAAAVRDLLVAAGVPAQAVSVAGRGEREPEVDTPDEVAEPRNRRVEIKLR